MRGLCLLLFFRFLSNRGEESCKRQASEQYRSLKSCRVLSQTQQYVGKNASMMLTSFPGGHSRVKRFGNMFASSVDRGHLYIHIYVQK